MFNFFRIFKVVYTNLILQRQKKLKTLQIDITSKCNLHCRGCYHLEDRKRRDKCNKYWISLMQKYKKLGIKNIWLFGGEPTLNPGLFIYAKKYFSLVYVITNGVVKIPKNFSFRIFVSMDGLREMNDYIRGDGVFDKIYLNYKNDKRVVINMTISKKNYMQIDSVIDYCKKTLKVHGISFQFYSPRYNIKLYERELILTDSDMLKVKKILEKYYNDQFVFITKTILDSFLRHELNIKNCYYRFYVDSYYSDGSKKKCCNAGTNCLSCRILPPYFHYVLDNYRDALTYVKFLNWL